MEYKFKITIKDSFNGRSYSGEFSGLNKVIAVNSALDFYAYEDALEVVSVTPIF